MLLQIRGQNIFPTAS